MRNNFETYKTIGLGDSKKIAIAMNGHGIGDDISAMPAIAQKISEGFEVTVFCKPFSRKCWTSLGCKVYPSVNPANDNEPYFKFGAFIGETFEGNREVFSLKNRFGVIYETPQWSIWKREDENGQISGAIFLEDRIKAFAELIETTVPKFFSWEEVLKPYRFTESYTLFAPDSASTNRTLLNQKKIFNSLTGNIKVFGQKAIYHRGKLVKLPSHGKKSYLKIALSKLYCSVFNRALGLWNKKIDNAKILCNTFDEFLGYVYSAKLVVSTDNGVMNAARAFGVPCISIFGATPEIASSQYEKYNDAPHEVIKCDFSGKGIDISERIDFILERTKQWQKLHIMA